MSSKKDPKGKGRPGRNGGRQPQARALAAIVMNQFVELMRERVAAGACVVPPGPEDLEWVLVAADSRATDYLRARANMVAPPGKPSLSWHLLSGIIDAYGDKLAAEPPAGHVRVLYVLGGPPPVWKVGSTPLPVAAA